MQSDSGPGRCDWWSADDHDLSEEDLPGVCVTTGTIDGPEDRWIIYRGTDNGILDVYADQDIELVFGGSEGGAKTNLRLENVGGEGWIPITLVWGDEADESTYSEVMIEVDATRYLLP
jgi:hypothetical protein